MLRKADLLGTVLIGLVAVIVGCNRVTTDSTDSLDSAVEESQPSASASAENDGEPATDGQPATVPDATTEDEGAPQDSLTIGDKAPSLRVEDWILGTATENFKDRIHVVEFWATWCGPCRTSMPHLSQLQTEYADDVTFVGITREDRPTVEAFLNRPQSGDADKTWNDVITYTIAIDHSDATNEAYMRAAGQTGIPTAFIVGRSGHVEWIGHPMSIDQPLQKIVAGSWDRAAERERFVQAQAAKVELRKVSQAMRRAKSSGDWTDALSAIESALAQIPDDSRLKMAKLQALLSSGDFEAANACAEGLAEENWDVALNLNAIAWALVTLSKEEADLALAQRVALRASSLSDDKQPSILDTVARVYYEQGDLESAIEWQQKACALAPSNSGLAKTLEHYTSLHKPVPLPVSMPDTAKLYWTDQAKGRICRANLDGSDIEELPYGNLERPRGIIVDAAAGHIYWGDYGADKIQRSDLAGANVSSVLETTTPGVRGLAVDEEKKWIYWTDRDLKKVFRANLDGSEVKEIITSDLAYPYSIVLDFDSGKLYVEDHEAGFILSAKLDGTEVERIVDLQEFAGGYPAGMALDPVDKYLYFTDRGESYSIKRVSLAGGEPELVVSEAKQPRGLVIDLKQRKLYWADIVDGRDQIMRADLDGTNVESLLTADIGAVRDLAIFDPGQR